MTTVTVTAEVEVEIDLSEIDSNDLQKELQARNLRVSGGNGELDEALLDQIYYALRDNDVDTLKRHAGTLVYVALGRII